MSSTTIQCLILACGNPVREDDGIGPWLAQWAKDRWRNDARIRVLCDHQWTPEMVEDVAKAESIIFIDCAADCAPGLVRIMSVEPATDLTKLGTHHLDASQLLALSRQLYGVMPSSSLLLTVGAASLELREGFSDAVRATMPEACQLLESSVLQILSQSTR